MASALSEEEISSFLTRIEAIPCFDHETALHYKVSAVNRSTNLLCSSSFEAATKFGFFLMHVGLASNNDTVCDPIEIVCECAESKEILCYNLLIGEDQKPKVSLLRVVKSSTFILDDITQTQRDTVDVLPPTVTEHQHDLSTEEDLLQSTLRNVFHHDAFKPLQKEIISATMTGGNVLGVLGTGGGKSLTFMLPAILSDKPTIVVVPTLSLIEDLLSRCLALDIKACKISGDVPPEVRNTCLDHLVSYKIIFFTPEMFANDIILDKLKNVSLERIVFDEAHTICSWGNTFRPQYKSASKELVKLPCPQLLLSATIPHYVVLELLELFGNFQIMKGTVLRENIFLNVKERSTGRKFYDQLAEFILKKPDECGIIYAVFPSDVSKIHSELIKRNVDCVKYHGQLSQIVKDASYHRWSSGEIKVIIANTSFGMGVDKNNVRFVIHAKVPTSIDEYFQQYGRAGRDGLESMCTLYYSFADKTALLKLFSSGENFTTQSVKLNNLINYLEDPVSCRHLSILQYYGEDRENYMCGDHCDNCKCQGTYIKTDGTSEALTVVQAMLELSTKKVSCQTLKLFLVGSLQKCIKDNELDILSTFGCLKGRFTPTALLDKFLHTLINNDVLSENIVVKGSSFSVLLNPGPKAHLVHSLSMYIEKYCKV